MEQIGYILIGWLLGLLSPAIIEKIKSEYTKRDFFQAVCTETADLQYRVVIVYFMLAQKYGTIDKDSLTWIKPYIENYTGNEPKESTLKLVDHLLNCDEDEFDKLINQGRAAPNTGLGLKLFSSSFLENNLTFVSNLPIELQVKIHEYRNALNLLNQEIIEARNIHKLTFDSTISDENHKIISEEVISKYKFIQGMCKRVVDKSQEVLTSKI